MAQNLWCRVCLAVDVRMHRITNTHHKKMFEKLSSTELNTGDERPHTICYICYSQLQRCCRFSDMCHKSEQFLREHLLHGTQGEVSPTEITHNLTTTAVQFTSIDFSSQEDNEVEVKEELLIKKEEIEVKEEPIDIEENTLAEDATVDDNPIGLEQPPLNVRTEMNNVCALPYGCDVCSKTFIIKKSLLQHMRIHLFKKRYACTRSKKKTCTNNSNFQRNTYLHNRQNQYACYVCNKTFTGRSNLQLHIRIHTGEKSFACNMCNKTFTQKSTLQKHIRIHTGEKPYACNICNKSFAHSCTLQKHMRIHTGEKPFACNMCNRTFTQKCTLIKHMRIHTGEKPYVCSTCNKTFSHSSTLHKHIKIHTGEKPYACNICNKSFIQKSDMQRHMRVHTK